jgi:putative peptidoglycan lipid II flippase
MGEKIKGILSGQNTVKSASWILVITLTLSNLLGLARDHFLTQKIPTQILSSYYAAFRIPDLLFNVIILGAIASAFIPVFTSYIANQKTKEAWHIANSIINIAIIFLIGLAAIFLIFMPQLISLLVPGFETSSRDLTISLGRLMLLSPIFFGLSYIFGGILNSYKRFFVYSLAPLIYNLAIILATLLFADRFGIYAVTFGVIFGAFLHWLIQVPVAKKLGYHYQLLIDFKHPAVKKIGRLMFPRAIGLGATQIMLLIFTAFASEISKISVAVYNLADNIQTMPTVVFGISFALAVFPSLSEAHSRQDKEKFGQLFSKTVRVILFMLVPMTVGFILLRAQIVRLILGSGHFGWNQTMLTADTLGFFAISLVFSGLIPLFARSFYAMHNTKTPMIITIISIAISIIFGWFLKDSLGITGLALAFSIGTFINALLLYIFLRPRLLEFNQWPLVKFLLKIAVASLVMGAVIQGSKYFIGQIYDLTRAWELLLQTGVAVILGAIVYFVLTIILRCEEIGYLKVLITKRRALANGAKAVAISGSDNPRDGS